MLYLNKQIERIYKITEKDYVKWCVENNMKPSKNAVRNYIRHLNDKILKEKK